MSVFGFHTIDEVRDLIRAKDYELAQIAGAYSGFAAKWKAMDPATAADWLADWTALQARYAAAKANAASFGIAENAWNGILAALQRDPAQYAKGDKMDLVLRLQAAQKHAIDFSHEPQPTAGDVDLSVYQGADRVIRKGEELAKSTGTGLLVVGGAALLILLLVKR